MQCASVVQLFQLSPEFTLHTWEGHPKLMDAEKAAGLAEALLGSSTCPVPKKMTGLVGTESFRIYLPVLVTLILGCWGPSSLG